MLKLTVTFFNFSFKLFVRLDMCFGKNIGSFYGCFSWRFLWYMRLRFYHDGWNVFECWFSLLFNCNRFFYRLQKTLRMVFVVTIISCTCLYWKMFAHHHFFLHCFFFTLSELDEIRRLTWYSVKYDFNSCLNCYFGLMLTSLKLTNWKFKKKCIRWNRRIYFQQKS